MNRIIVTFEAEIKGKTYHKTRLLLKDDIEEYLKTDDLLKDAIETFERIKNEIPLSA